jgi:hypothetical protein
MEKSDHGEAGNMEKSQSKRDASPSELIDARIEDLDHWRGEMLSRLRALIKEADPEVAEEVKWRKPSNSMLGSRCGPTTGSFAPARRTRTS